jgi:hypothetical protein
MNSEEIMQKIDYVTVISPVKEITLWGRAEAVPWQTYLKEEGLAPFIQNGKVELLISTVDSRYMGFRFQELSISIMLSESEYFLAHAYNSIPLFALAERKFFQTPYYAGKLLVEKNRLALNDGTSFEAKLAPNAPCLKTGDEDWQLLIRLPKALRQKADKPHFFYARLQGYTEGYQADLASLSMKGEEAVFKLLRQSQFQPEEWRIRASATHSKSKTLV